MKAWRRFAPFVAQERSTLTAVSVLAIAGIAADALLPWPLKLAIDNVIGAQPLPAGAEWIARLPGGGAPPGLLAYLAAGLVCLFLAAQALQLGKAVLQSRIASRLQYALGAAVLAQAQALSLVYHRRSQKGDLARRIASDTSCIGTLLTGVLLPLAIAVLSLVVLFAIMWKLDPLLAVVAGAVALPMGVLMRVFGARMTDRAYEHQQAEGEVWAIAEQTLSALPVVQAFGREAHESSRFGGVARASIRAYMRSLATQVQFKVGIDACEALGIAAVMLLGGMHVAEGRITLGTLVVFLSYLAALYVPLLALAYLAPTWATAFGSARRVVAVLDADETIVEAPQAKALPRGTRGRVQLEKVVFGYRPGHPVLRGVDLDVRQGETVALVGASGAGKSTLVALVPRLVDPWEGRVLIDGCDVREASLASVRAACAIVLQDPFILPLTVADNIAYARPGATRAAIEAAARAANAHEFIVSLERGYDTPIGERGVTLSAGQRQRLSLARALLKDAPILILDEPTSALDVRTEASVMEAIARLQAGRTAVVIAHRLSTIQRADRIVVIDRGEIAESGTHDALVRSSALYRTLYLSQLTAFEADRAQASS